MKNISYNSPQDFISNNNRCMICNSLCKISLSCNDYDSCILHLKDRIYISNIITNVEYHFLSKFIIKNNEVDIDIYGPPQVNQETYFNSSFITISMDCDSEDHEYTLKSNHLNAKKNNDKFILKPILKFYESYRVKNRVVSNFYNKNITCFFDADSSRQIAECNLLDISKIKHNIDKFLVLI